MPASQLATPLQGGPGRAASAGVSQGSLPSAPTAEPAETPLDAAGRLLSAGMRKLQKMWVDEPARRELEQQALAAIEAKLQEASSVQGVATILELVQNLQSMQGTHYDQARDQAEPAGDLLNNAVAALEALEAAESMSAEKAAGAMSGAGRLDFSQQPAADLPPPAAQVPLPTWLAGPHYNDKDPLKARRSHCPLYPPSPHTASLSPAPRPSHARLHALPCC